MNTASELRVIPAMWLDAGLLATEYPPQWLDRLGWDRSLPRRENPRVPFNVRSVATAIAYVECGPVERVSVPRLLSYALKHAAEKWSRSIGFASYVGNGDFILAARYCGIRTGRPNGANCLVAVRYECSP